MEIYLFKSVNPSEFRTKLEEAVLKTSRGSIQWGVPGCELHPRSMDEYLGWLCFMGGNASLQISTNCYRVMDYLADVLNSPLVVVSFQEKSFWETSLYVDRELKLNFSASPTHWGIAESKMYFADVKVISEIWGIAPERLDRYFVDWGLTKIWNEEYKVMSPTYRMRGKRAYPEDKHEYGHVEQGYDFIAALGAGIPQDGERFVVMLPPN